MTLTLQQRLMDRFEPEDEITTHLVERLTLIIWRTNRADVIEADLLSCFPTLSQRRGRLMFADFDATRMKTVMRYQRDLELAFFRTISALQMMQTGHPTNEPTKSDSPSISID